MVNSPECQQKGIWYFIDKPYNNLTFSEFSLDTITDYFEPFSKIFWGTSFGWGITELLFGEKRQIHQPKLACIEHQVQHLVQW